MNLIITILKKIIEDEILNKTLEKEGDRFLMNGLPLSVLDDLLEELGTDKIGDFPLVVVEEGGTGCLEFSEQGDVSALSGKYTESNATSVRNHYDGGYLLAIPEGEEVGGSLAKSIEMLECLDVKVLLNLLERVLPGQQDLTDSLVRHIRYYSRNSDTGNESNTKLFWRVLYGIARLCPSLEVNEVLSGILFVLGLPSCSSAEVQASPPSKLNSMKILTERKNSIASRVYDLGISGAFDEWRRENRNSTEICDALGACKEHILDQVEDSANFFDDPQRYYGLAEKEATLPSWHTVLEKDIWFDIINRSQPQTSRAQIRLQGHTDKKTSNILIYACNQPINAMCVDGKGTPLEASNWEVIDSKGNILINDFPAGKEIKVESPPSHSGKLILRACFDGSEPIKSSPFVSLASYSPLIVFRSNGEEEKISLPLPISPTEEDDDEEGVDLLGCEVKFPRTGGYSCELYLGLGCEAGRLYAKDADDTNQTEEKDLRCVNEEANVYRFQLVTDDSSTYEVRRCKTADGRFFTLKIEVTAEEGEPQHSSSWLEVLRARQISDKNFQVTALSSDNELNEVQSAKLLPESKDSFHPLAANLSSNNLRPPAGSNWQGAVLGHDSSSTGLVHDIRPGILGPPDELLASWEKLRGILLEASESSGILEGVRFFDLVLEKDFKKTKKDYLSAYSSWIEREPEKACWWEVVTLHEDMDQAVPVGMLLSPLHPLRLGWICDAQEVMDEAASKKAREGGKTKGMPPLVGLDSVHAPGFWVLHSEDTSYTFYSLRTSGSYWGLLVSGEHYSSQEKKDEICHKLAAFGMKVPPSGTPLDDAHIREILDEVKGFRITRRTLKIGLQSNMENRQGGNSVVGWFRMIAEANADEDQRPDWGDILPPSVEGYSENSESSPDSNMLASLHELAPSELRWYESWDHVRNKILDVILQTEIIPASTSVKDKFHLSPVSPDYLLSRRISMMEPVGADKLTSASFDTNQSDSLLGEIASKVHEREQPFMALREVYNSASLGTGLQSDFFGLPSAGTDPSLVTRLVPGGGVIWKLSLPSYAADNETGSGFFLLARINNQIEKCTATALEALVKTDTGVQEMPSQAKVRGILQELGQRGFDSVKHIADQEFLARGNLGLLVASRLLAGHKNNPGILPINPEDQSGAVVVPMDPFRPRLEKLRATVLSGAGPRPDQLVVGFRHIRDKVIIKLTPVESKCFEGRASMSTRQGFVRNQCGRFIDFLRAFFLPEDGMDFKGWNLARRMVLVDWFEYGLNCLTGDKADLVQDMQLKVISKVISGEFAVEIDKVGRLVMVDGSTSTEFCRTNEVSTCIDLSETLQFNKREAYEFLINETLPEPLEPENVRDHWGLLPASEPSATVDPQQMVEGSENGFLNAPDDLEADEEGMRSDNEDLSPESEEVVRANVEEGAISLPSTVDEIEPVCDQEEASTIPAEVLAGAAPKILMGESDSSRDVHWQPFGEIRPSGEHERLLGNSHAYIAGSSGYGKSHLLEKIIGNSLLTEGVVPLFFDFVGDFARSCPNGYKIIDAADGFDMNPLRLLPNDEGAFGRPRTQAYQLASLFKHALGLGDQQVNKAREAIQNAYGDRGIPTGENLREEPSIWPNFEELGQHIQNDPDERFVARMKAVFEWEVFKGTSGSFASLLAEATVINFQELRNAGNEIANVVSQIVLMGIFNYLKSGVSCDGLKYLIVIDEAHRVSKLPAIEDMLREVRKFGCGVWMASQSPDDFSEQLRSLTTSKFIFRLETDSDARLAEKELSAASGTLRQDIRDLPVGECFYRDPQNSPYIRLKVREG